jgi:hypothetical protein
MTRRAVLQRRTHRNRAVVLCSVYVCPALLCAALLAAASAHAHSVDDRASMAARSERKHLDPTAVGAGIGLRF